jgi:hypothetical protein
MPRLVMNGDYWQDGLLDTSGGWQVWCGRNGYRWVTPTELSACLVTPSSKVDAKQHVANAEFSTDRKPAVGVFWSTRVAESGRRTGFWTSALFGHCRHAD